MAVYWKTRYQIWYEGGPTANFPHDYVQTKAADASFMVEDILPDAEAWAKADEIATAAGKTVTRLVRETVVVTEMIRPESGPEPGNQSGQAVA